MGIRDEPLDLLHMGRHLLPIDRLQPTMGFELLDDRLQEGQKRAHLVIEGRLLEKTLPGVNDLIAKQQVIDLPVATEPIEIDLPENLELLLVEGQLALMVAF